MKLIIDTIEKTIKIEDQVNFGEFFDYIKQILPNDLWRFQKKIDEK